MWILKPPHTFSYAKKRRVIKNSAFFGNKRRAKKGWPKKVWKATISPILASIKKSAHRFQEKVAKKVAVHSFNVLLYCFHLPLLLKEKNKKQTRNSFFLSTRDRSRPKSKSKKHKKHSPTWENKTCRPVWLATHLLLLPITISLLLFSLKTAHFSTVKTGHSRQMQINQPSNRTTTSVISVCVVVVNGSSDEKEKRVGKNISFSDMCKKTAD